MTKREEYLADCKSMFNGIGITATLGLGRLVGMGEDEHDYYYIYRHTGGAETRQSMVGWFIPLRGVIPKDAYDYLEHVHKLNGCPPAEHFLDEMQLPPEEQPKE